MSLYIEKETDKAEVTNVTNDLFKRQVRYDRKGEMYYKCSNVLFTVKVYKNLILTNLIIMEIFT